jgi:hypothetical protein
MKALKLLSFVAASFAMGVAANAGNQALVDTLVRKGYLTSEEASQMSSGSGVMTSSSRHHTTGVTLNGLIHAQYDYYNVETNGTTDERTTHRSIPSLRRVQFGLEADLTEDWSGHLQVGNSSVDDGVNSTGFIDTSYAYIQWAPMDEMHLQFGANSGAFGHESSVASKDLKLAHRSMASRYFEEVLGFGEEAVGVFMHGEFGEGFYYSASATRNDGSFDNGTTVAYGNGPNLSALMGFRGTSDDLHYNVGVEGGYIHGRFNSTNTTTKAVNQFYAFGMFADMHYMDFSMMAEAMVAGVKDGRKDPTTANKFKSTNPYGVTLIPSFMLDEDFELVGMFSYMNTQGTDAFRTNAGRAAGGFASDLVRGSLASNSSANVNLKSWYQFYVGGNWYILGNDLKLTVGYDYTKGETTVDGVKTSSAANSSADKTDIHHFGARLQLLF